MKKKKLRVQTAKILILLLITVINSPAHARGKFTIQSITVSGNKVTKVDYIIRESGLTVGDKIWIHDTNTVFTTAVNNLKNTNSFLVIKHSFKYTDTLLNIHFHVKERWRLFPIPLVELADRNFNEWWQQRGRSLDRLEYGLRFYHINTRGRFEKLKIITQNGFTPKYELFYTIPYISKQKNIGLKYSISYSQNKRVATQITDHKLDYIETNQVNRRRFYTGLTWSFKNKIYHKHFLTINYRHNQSSDTVASYNYFPNIGNRFNYLELNYTYDFDKRNIQAYATEGQRILANFEYINDINSNFHIAFIEASASQFYQIKNTFIGHHIKARVATKNTIPFFINRNFGYEQDFVRGHELMVINAAHYLLQKNQLKFKVLDKSVNIKLLPKKHFGQIPLKLFMGPFVDFGYIYTEDVKADDVLSNQFLTGAGLGLDIVTYYDLVTRIEASITNTRQKGVFLHFKSSF